MELGKIGAIIAMAAGVLIIVGSIGPWITADLGLISVSVSGTDGDGVFTLLLGIATVVFAGLSLKFKPKVMGIVATATASLAVLVVVIDFAMAASRLADVPAAARDAISFSWGIYLTLFASLAAVVGGAIIILAVAKSPALKSLTKVLSKKAKA